MNNYNTTTLDKFSIETDTCYKHSNDNFIEDFLSKFQDSFCYTFVLQFLMVSLMYATVGKGKYWGILFYASLAGFLGAMVENATVAYICSTAASKSGYIFTFLIDELFWIPNEYAIPLLNLIKMKAFSYGKTGTITKYIILLLSIPFIFFRLCIGYYRMTYGYLQNQQIRTYHGYAFAVMANADIICSAVLIYLLKSNSQKMAVSGSNINKFIKQSSYVILITVDIVSAILAILNIVSNVESLKDKFPSKLFTPFHCLKCSSILILAVDAFIFKYDVNVSSNNGSMGTRNNGNSDSYNTLGNNYNNNSANYSYKSKIVNINNEINNTNTTTSSNNKKNSMIYITPYNYSTSISIEKQSPMSNNKTIVKNYSNSKNKSMDYSYNSSEQTIYSPQSFGFLSNLNNIQQ
ncbi:hypothetical protein PIROE2DRAFT_12669 [Piromyces sp. E2]|nr:hypothetical protein PIROE2DRAFT_12669 [Piromyces sp. E2]|eukprot:OUM61332.1 hypothetical protein PIROE2DRAFT_12669 [Piromyces sp. E2]